MPDLDYENPIAVTRDIHWVGFRDKEARLHCNPYLLIDDDDVVLIDPGSIPHFPIVMRKVIDLVNPERISLIVVGHQDPDVCGNLAVVEDVINRSDLKVAAHSNTIRLIRHYGLRSDLYSVDEHDYAFRLNSGRTLRFMFTPYLHSPGAIVTYDEKTKSLFSSDIFGALSEQWSLFDCKGFPQHMDTWHQRYMPSSRILKPCMERLERLAIDRILPQHGSVIEGAQVMEAIEHLKGLPCGIDLMERYGD